jgi:hypothetical protein
MKVIFILIRFEWGSVQTNLASLISILPSPLTFFSKIAKSYGLYLSQLIQGGLEYLIQ